MPSVLHGLDTNYVANWCSRRGSKLHTYAFHAMETLQRIWSFPIAKPYRSKHLRREVPFVHADGYLAFAPNDISNPHNWSTPRRWYITSIAVLLAINATLGSSSPSGAFPAIARDLHVSVEATSLTVTLYIGGFVFGPLFFAPLSEFFGRRTVFLVTFSLYICFNILSAFAPNFTALLISRLLTGTLASATQSNSPGIIADLWPERDDRGYAMACFTALNNVGPALGPLAAGYLEITKDWRWLFYALIWFNALSFGFLLTLPETYAPAILLSQARCFRKRGINVRTKEEILGDRDLYRMLKIALKRPWRILLDPISLFAALYIALVYTLLYMLFSIYPIIFQEKRGWNPGKGELPLIGVMIGPILGSFILLYFTRLDVRKVAKGDKITPEDRLPVAMIGGVSFTITLFWFAWSGQYPSVPWILPTLAGTCLSASINFVSIGFYNYIADSYLEYTASAMAANTVVRSLPASSTPLWTSQMFKRLGVGGGGSLVGGISALLIPIPFVFYRYGEVIRRRSKFAHAVNVEVEGREKDAEVAATTTMM
jgi:MFS transporter, DHA1 family, multidrug resistance protein